MRLRPYQTEAKKRLYEALRETPRTLLQLPTGAGKTVLFSSVASDAIKRGNRVLVLAHRTELLSQAAKKLRAYSLDPCIVAPNNIYRPLGGLFVASVSTMYSRIRKGTANIPEAIDLIITDEAHHAVAASYREIYDRYPSAKHIGVTATPYRADGSGFSDVFQELVVGVQMSELIRDGYLTKPVSYTIPVNADLSKVKVGESGEYNMKDLWRKLAKSMLPKSYVDNWKKFAPDARNIFFAVNIEHSLAVRDAYNAAGIPAAHIDGKTPSAEREDILADFAAGRYVVLCNVDIATEGFDMPDIECVQIGCPTKSLSKYLQMGGRGLRTAEGKSHALHLDHANNIYDHGYLEEDREWSLHERKIDWFTEKRYVDRRTGKRYTPSTLPKTADPRNIELVTYERDDYRLRILEDMCRMERQAGEHAHWAWNEFTRRFEKPTVQEIRYYYHEKAKPMGSSPGWISYQLEKHGYVQVKKPSKRGGYQKNMGF